MDKEKTDNRVSGCIGCGVCATNEPEIFGLNKDGLAEIIDRDKFEQFNKEEAGWDCPVSAI